MNSLGRDIKMEERVVLSSQYWKGEEDDRTVTCHGGFGMRQATIGTALVVEFPDGEITRAEGYEIDKVATNALKEEKEA